MKRIKDLLLNNLFWKLASLVLAVLVWFFVLNTADPVKTRELSVSITILNEDKLKDNGRILVNREDLANTTLKVSVRGNTKDLDRLEKSATGITASVDVNLLEIYSTDEDIDEYTTEIAVVKSSAFSDIEIVNKNISTLTVTTERYISEERPVNVKFTGDAADGYKFDADSVTISPSTVTVSGPKSAMQKINKVVIDINIDGKSEDIVDEATPAAYDANEVMVDDIEISSAVSYTATAFKLGILEINELAYTGEPAEGYIVTDVKMDPTKVQVMGSEEAINKLTPITLNPYDISGETGNVANNYSLQAYLPDDVYLVNRDIGIVDFEFVIEQLITRTITVPKSDLVITGMTSGTEILADSVDVTVTGAASAINDEENMQNLRGYVNLEGLEVGEHEVPVNFTWPKGVEGDVPYVTVVISTTEVAEEETGTDTDAADGDNVDADGEVTDAVGDIIDDGEDDSADESGEE